MHGREGDVGGDSSGNVDSTSSSPSDGSGTNQDDHVDPLFDNGDGGKNPPAELVVDVNSTSTAGGDCAMEAFPPSAPLNELCKECNLPGGLVL